MLTERLAEVQLEQYKQPTVLLAISVGGEEDVPHVSPSTFYLCFDPMLSALLC